MEALRVTLVVLITMWITVLLTKMDNICCGENSRKYGYVVLYFGATLI